MLKCIFLDDFDALSNAREEDLVEGWVWEDNEEED